MRFNRLLHLIAFQGKAHRESPASGRLTTKMPEAGAPSQSTCRPISAVTFPNLRRRVRKPAIANTGHGPFRPGRLIFALAVVAAAMFAVVPEQTSAQNEPYDVVVLANGSVVEGEVVGFYVIASPRPPEGLKVQLDLTQSGNFAARGQLGKRTVTVSPAGYVNLWVSTIDDSVNEADGTITATVIPGENYRAGHGSDGNLKSAVNLVRDNDVPVVQISGGSKISEGGTAKFTLTARPRPASPIQVTVAVSQSGNFAASGAIGQQTVSIDTNGNGVLKVGTVSDGVDEDDGVITATLNAGTGYRVGAPATATIAVSDGGDPTPRISVSAPASIQEGETAIFTVTGEPAPVTPIAVSVQLSEQGSFATDGEISDRTVTVGTDGSSTFTVATTNDRTAEPDGTITATVVGADGYLVGTPSRAAVTVQDTTPAVTIAAGPAIDEGGTATFTLTSTPALSPGFDANVVVSQSGDFVNYQSDLGSRTVSIGAGGSGTFTVETYDDTMLEANGQIIARVTSGSGYGVGTPSTASVSVADTTPRISVSAGPTIIEGSAATFTLTADSTPASTLYVDVNVSESGSFAASGETGVRSVTIDPTTGQGSFTVATVDDQSDERKGSVTARVEASGQPPAYYAVGSPRSASVTVNDDDPGSRIMASIGDATVVESSAPSGQQTFLEFPVTVDKSGWVIVTLQVKATAETSSTAPATAGVDFKHSHSKNPLTVHLIRTTKKTLRFVVIDDDVYESKPETFHVEITNVEGGEIARGRATGTIVDDPLDAPRGTPVVTISPVTKSVIEGGDIKFDLSAKPMPKHDLLVTVNVSNDTGDAFLASGQEGTREVRLHGLNDAEFKYYKGTRAQYFTVKTADDAVWEEDGSIIVTVEADPDRNADGEYDVSADKYEATADVKDNERGIPVVTITGGSAVVEGQRAGFTLRAEPAPERDLKVAVTVQDQSGDFVDDAMEGSREVIIPGVDDKTFAQQRHTTHKLYVGTVDDNAIESSGEVQVTLELDPDNNYDANTQPYRATVEVRDNDTPTVSVSGPDSRTLEGGNVTFTLMAKPTPSTDVLVDVTVSTPNNDYVDSSDTGSYTVTIPAGSAKATFDVATNDDSVEETGDGTVTLTIDDGGAAYAVALAPDNAATAAIADNDGLLTVSIDDAEVNEGNSAKIRVWLSKPAAEDVQILWGTATQPSGLPRSTASGRDDYGYRSGQLRFREGEVEKFLYIRTIRDQIDDPDEFFYVELWSPRPADVLTVLDSIAKITIR